MWQLKLVRHRKKLIAMMAAFPLLQATTCDLTAINGQIAQSLLSAGLSAFVGTAQQTLLQFFPSSELLATLFGSNRSPFF